MTTDAGPGLTVRLDVPHVGMPVVAAWEDVVDDTLLRFTGE